MSAPESAPLPEADAGEARRADLWAAFLLAGLATAFIAFTVWPGLMSFDSLYAYRQSIEGVDTALWPPVHDYLFFIFRHLPGNPGGLLLFQSFALFLSANLIIRHLAPSATVSVPLMAMFFGLFVAFPTLLGALIVLWKDVTVGTFAVMAVALWLSGTRRFSWARFLALFACVTISIALRYNALPLVLPFMLLVVWRPAGPASTGRQQAAAGLGIVVTLALAYASTLWRLPDLQRLPSVAPMMTNIKLWDIAGTSVCAGQSLLTDVVTPGDPFTVEELRALYNPRHINLTFDTPLWNERLGTRYVWRSVPAIEQRWREILVAHPGCYLATRLAVFEQQMGLNTPVTYYPTHGGIDDNPYGFTLAFPERAARLIQMIVEGANAPWRRGYVLAGLALFFLLPALWIDRRGAILPLALYAGTLGFLGLLFVAAPAGDARYIFPPGVFAALVIVTSLACIARARHARRVLAL
ncbi:hypothetical protein AncyloWKF20_16910 [Ancylobacter sp. WKF20]|uniref:hypothetical protein n=1 Tax=Ancylobacter sp. WKF20 TaxID=3039801 RepID=UPI0024346138|nr:hypothetical protein [Ancylobacter sp. WKF20]WGD29435.1 hypothetical protein AncyloWKF20_16910 [Ancylobacter sp. WKF20]